jgi:site-specific DNA recombinase
MLADVRAGKIDCVLAYKIDRLTRSVKDFHALLEVFDRHSVKFVSVTQSLDTQSPMGRLMRNILLDFAEFEREMTADRTRDKMQQRAEKGLWNGGIRPYGYTTVEKRLVPDPEEAPRLQFMFRRFVKDPSTAALRDDLARKGWRTRAGTPWSKNSIQQILKNPIYAGLVRFKGQVYDGVHEPLIADELFRKVQEVRPDRRHVRSRIKRVFLLKGLIKCSDCGSFMTPHYTQKRRRDGSSYRIPYYRCTKTMHQNNSVCKIKHLNANQIEDTIVRELNELSKNEVYVRKTVAELNRDRGLRIKPLREVAARVRKQLLEIEAEIDRYVKAVGKGTLSIGRLEKEIQTRQKDQEILQEEHEDLKRRINEESAASVDSELVLRRLQDFRSSFGAMAPPEQAEALQCLLREVVVYPEKLVLEVFELPEFAPSGSQKREVWLPGCASLRTLGRTRSKLRSASVSST